MISANTLIKKLLSVNNCVIDGFDFETDIDGVTILRVYLHPFKRHSNCCPACGKSCPVYDKSRVYRKWRALDLGGTIVDNMNETFAEMQKRGFTVYTVNVI